VISLNKNRNIKIIANHDLLREIVYCIVKATGEDQQQYLEENYHETNNALIFLRGDDINTNLRNYVVKDNIELHPFKRYGWSGRILIDRKERITYSIISKRTLESIIKKNNRKSPHYLQSILYIENKDCISKAEQMILPGFRSTTFKENILVEDFKEIFQGTININEDYKHYIISYDVKYKEITDISSNLLDKDFNIVDEISLMQYVKPDFAKLTDIEPIEETSENIIESKKELISIKSGLKPKLREPKKRVEKK